MTRLPLLYGAIVLVVVCLNKQTVDGHLSKVLNPKNWFKSLKQSSIFCRMRHHRVILNKFNKAVTCARTCPSGYEDRYSLHWGHHCKPYNFPKGCGDAYCLTCQPNYFWLYSSEYTKRCVTKCPPGYITTADGMCEKCLNFACKQCTNKWSCTECKNGYALQKFNLYTSSICVRRCARGRAKIRQNGIVKCLPFIRTTTKTTTTTTTTMKMTTPDLPPPLVITDSTTETPPFTDKGRIHTTIKTTQTSEEVSPKGCRDHACFTCLPGYFRFIQQIGGNTCLEECPGGYKELGTICVPCHDRRCQSCKSSIGRCDKCFPGYSMLYDKRNVTSECVKFCPTSHYKKNVDGTDVCLRNSENENIPKGCNDDRCITCKPGFYRFILQTGGNTCLEECPGGYTKMETICIGCHDKRCQTCETSIGKCDKCFPGYSMLHDSRNLTSECVKYCPEDYSKRSVNGVSMCTRKTSADCPVANCKKCVSDRLHRLHKGCEECAENFVLYRSTFNDYCYTTCPPQHFNTTNNKTNVKYCAKCEVPFCKVCANSDTCMECIEPMVIDRFTGKCKVCDAFYQYSFEEKKCIPADENHPETSAFDEVGPW